MHPSRSNTDQSAKRPYRSDVVEVPSRDASRGGTFICEDCPKVFSKKMHYKYGLDSPKRTCSIAEVCSKHRKTHIRPQKCPLCPSAFALRSDLIRHLPQHEGPRAQDIYRCCWQGCTFKGTVRKDNLLKHMSRAHLKPKRLKLDPQQQEQIQQDIQQLYKKSVQVVRVRKHQDVLIALYEAVKNQADSEVLDILEDLTDMTTRREYATAAMIAATTSGLTSMVSLLLEQGADIEHEGRFGTPLTVAAREGHEATVSLLLEQGADIEHGGRLGTPLTVAARQGQEAVVRLLLEQGADIENEGRSDNSALIVAAKGGHKAVVSLLLKSGADIEHEGRSGSTALIIAAEGGHKAVVSLLLKSGADIEHRRGPARH